MKKSFILHTDTLSVLNKLTDSQCADLFRAIRDFHIDGSEPTDPLIAIIFEPFRNQFVRDQEKYGEFQQKQSEKGKRSVEAKRLKKSKEQDLTTVNHSQPQSTTVNHGQPRSTTVNRSQPEPTESTYSVSVSVSDSVNVKEEIPPTPLPEVSISSNAEIPSGNNTRPARKREPKKVWKAPELDEVIAYFRAEGYSDQAANKFFKYYSSAEPPWHDIRGNPVKGWKQKAQSVWFKPENETKAKEIQATSGTRSEYVMGQRFNPRTGEPIRTT